MGKKATFAPFPPTTQGGAMEWFDPLSAIIGAFFGALWQLFLTQWIEDKRDRRLH